MSLMISYATAYSEGEDAEEEWKGYLYAATLLIVTFTQSLLTAQSSKMLYLVAMQLRTALTSVIYRKGLFMSSAARNQTTVGEGVNLMAVDIQRFMDLIPFLHVLWTAPITIGLCSYFMYLELGYAVFAGIAVLILAIPLNVIAGYISKKYQIAQMANKDKRVKLMNEILGGMKVLKLYAWEKSFASQILDIRAIEIAVLKKSAWLSALISFVWNNVPLLVALASFTTFMFTGEDRVLTADIAFVTISYINIIKLPMAFLPFMIIGMVQVRVSLDRLNKFFNFEELKRKAQKHSVVQKQNEADLRIEKTDFYWGNIEESPKILSEIELSVKRGSLTAIVGPVGSGKSSLLSAFLDEMEDSSSSASPVTMSGTIAYVPQVAWMMNATVKDNILFGKENDKKNYDNVISACALSTDFAILPGGDQTEIGEKGINLSGGQKQRVSLARATYSDADIFLLDDPLSAVDSHVGKHLFEKIISSDEGLLREKTRLLVTHAIAFLPQVDYIIVMKEGRISEQGTYTELVEKKGAFAQLLQDNEKQKEELLSQEERADIDEPRDRTYSRSTTVNSATSSGTAPEEDNPGTRLIQKEATETGKVKRSVYLYYMRNVGITGCSVALLMQVMYQAALMGTNYWVSVWTEGGLGDPEEEHWRNVYLGVYGGLGAVQSVSLLILSIVMAISTLNASKRMHQSMLEHVIHSPMQFFDTTPLGRIVNRFAKDVDICDNTLPMNIQQTLNSFFNLLGTAILIIIVLPIFTVVIVPVAIIFAFLQSIYVASSRQLKRLESVSRSPVYSHFGETLQGVSTIRAFDRERSFIQQSEVLVDNNQKCYYPAIMSNRWIQIRLDALGNIVTFLAALFTILRPNAIDPSEVGLIITYALNITIVFAWLVRMSTDLETNVVAVERIKEYSQDLDQEADWRSKEESEQEEIWPSQGHLEFKHFSLRYREGLDLVIHDVSFSLEGGQTMGIVGRTGLESHH